MRRLYLLQDVGDAPVLNDLSSTLVIQDDNALTHVMLNITNFHLIAHKVFDSIPRSGVAQTCIMKARQMRGTSDYIIVFKSKGN